MTGLDVPLISDSDSDEALRRQHLGREANLRGIGILMYLSSACWAIVGGLVCLMALGVPIGSDSETATPVSVPGQVTAFLFGIAIVGLSYWVWRSGSAIRRFSRTGRPAALVISVLYLINLPIGTIIGIAMLCLLLGEKADFVLSPEYQELVGRTPHIEAKLSIVTKIFIGLLVAVLALVLFALVIAFLNGEFSR